MFNESDEYRSNAIEQKSAALRTGLAAHLGILFGVAATLLGGAIGAFSGRLTKKFSAARGFTVGAIISGGVTSVIQLVNWSRIGKAASRLQMGDLAPSLKLPASSDFKALEEQLAEKKSYVESLEQKRNEQNCPLR